MVEAVRICYLREWKHNKIVVQLHNSMGIFVCDFNTQNDPSILRKRQQFLKDIVDKFKVQSYMNAAINFSKVFLENLIMFTDIFCRIYFYNNIFNLQWNSFFENLIFLISCPQS